jgi:molybdopterin converting factor small subunit
LPQVKVPPPYRGPTQGLASIDVSGDTVRACLAAVGSRYPGFGEQLFDPSGDLHGFVTLFLNGDEIERGALDTAVSPDDEVAILAAIAGGSGPALPPGLWYSRRPDFEEDPP